jgi:hemerythrin-like metal-binding protein
MALMDWTDALALGVGPMDATHREFVDHLNALDAAGDDALLGLLDAFIAHTEAHFAQESLWMRATGFPPVHCHEAEHAGVLGVMREVRGHVAQGKVHVGRVLARELPEWLRHHLDTMDGALASFMRTVEYDPAGETAPA